VSLTLVAAVQLGVGITALVPGAVMLGAAGSDNHEICDAAGCVSVRDANDADLASAGVALVSAGGVLTVAGLVTLFMTMEIDSIVSGGTESNAGVPKATPGGLAWSF
jgi:hypothetical protein